MNYTFEFLVVIPFFTCRNSRPSKLLKTSLKSKHHNQNKYEINQSDIVYSVKLSGLNRVFPLYIQNGSNRYPVPSSCVDPVPVCSQ